MFILPKLVTVFSLAAAGHVLEVFLSKVSPSLKSLRRSHDHPFGESRMSQRGINEVRPMIAMGGGGDGSGHSVLGFSFRVN